MSLEEKVLYSIKENLNRGLGKINCSLKDQSSFSFWLPLCVDGVQYYTTSVTTADSSTGALTTIIYYKLGETGAITTTAPSGSSFKSGYCNFIVSGNTSIGNITSTTTGTVAGGKASVTFTCTLGAGCTVNGQPIALNTTITFKAYYDEGAKIYFRTPDIPYVATGGSLQISFVN